MLKLHFYNHKTLRHLKKQSFYHCCKCCLCKAYSPDTFQTHLVYKQNVKEEFLYCISLETTATAQNAINSIQKVFLNAGEKLCGVCMDGVLEMLGCKSRSKKNLLKSEKCIA